MPTERMMGGEVLADLPTIRQGQADDLKIETADLRVWRSRMTVADGMAVDNAISVERLINGVWILVHDDEVRAYERGGAA